MIYLDHAALTPPEEAALVAMVQVARDDLGHPDAIHGAGRRARAHLDRARVRIAEYLGCAPAELVFFPSATEALRSALAFALADAAGPVLSSSLEHPAVLDGLRAAIGDARAVRWLAMPAGRLDPEGFRVHARDAAVVALARANHELGTATDIAPLVAEAPRAWWVIDAVQAAPWLDLSELLGDRVFLAMSSGKLGAPAGVGVLRVPGRVAWDRDLVAKHFTPRGTPPLLAIVALGVACDIRRVDRESARARALGLAERLADGLTLRPGVVRNGVAPWATPIVNVSAPELEGRVVESALDLRDVAIARTSACRQRMDGGSAVVAAAHPEEAWRAATATRWSLGRHSSPCDVEGALAAFHDAFPAAAAATSRGV